MQLKTAIERFLVGYFSTCKRSEKTVHAYTIDLRQFREYAGSRARLEKISPETLEGWAAELKDAGYASASIRRKFAAVKVFFGYWVRRGDLEASPTWRIRLDLAPERRLPHVLTIDEVQQLLEQAKRELGNYPCRCSTSIDSIFLALRNLAIVELLFATGMRVGELVLLKLDDLQLKQRTLIVNGKGDRQRLAILPDAESHRTVSIYNTHRRNLEISHPLLIINSFGGPLSAQGASKVISRLACEASIPKRVTAHTLRHTVATLLLQNGANIRVVQEILGHSSISTTERYTHVTFQHLSKEVLQTHPSVFNMKRRHRK